MRVRFGPTVLILLVILASASTVRLFDLTDRTMTHIEIYVPGIDLPEGLSVPEARFTPGDVFHGLFRFAEPHPGGYYFVMLAWTRLAGSGLLALRLPSALCGILAVLLLYLLARTERDRGAALLAAGLLAFNGYHVFWSQLAKSNALSCLLGVLSTLLLYAAAREISHRRRLLMQLLYAGVTLFGLAVTHYFWFLLATQVLWVLARSGTRGWMPVLLKVQAAVVVLGTPLLSLALFQSRRPSYLGSGVFENAGLLYQFGILFQPDYNRPTPSALFGVAGVALMLVGVTLFLLGLLRGRKQEEEDEAKKKENPSGGPWLAVAAIGSPLACLAILSLGRYTGRFDQRHSQLVTISCVLPVLVGLGSLVSARMWARLERPLSRLVGFLRIPRTVALSSLLGTVPIVILILASPVVNLVAPRSLLLFVPFILLVIARGARVVARASRAWIALAVLLAAIHPLSLWHYRRSHHEHPTGYACLAGQLAPQIESGDLVFIEAHWVTTPIFYYLDMDRCHLVGRDYSEAVRSDPTARVWRLEFEGLPPAEGMLEALASHRSVRRVDARWISAELYLPR